MVFPNGSKPRYSGAVASGRGATAEQAQLIGVGSSTYDPNASDFAVWGGLPASMGSGAVRWRRRRSRRRGGGGDGAGRKEEEADDEEADDDDDDATGSVLHFGARRDDAEAFKRATQVRDADTQAPETAYREVGARLLRERASRSHTFRDSLSEHRRGAGAGRGGDSWCLSVSELGAGAADVLTGRPPPPADIQGSAAIEDAMSRVVTESKLLELLSGSRDEARARSGSSIARVLTQELFAELQRAAGAPGGYGAGGASGRHEVPSAAVVTREALSGCERTRVTDACVGLVDCLLEQLRVTGRARQAASQIEAAPRSIRAWERVERACSSGIVPCLTKPWRVQAARTKLHAALVEHQRQRLTSGNSGAAMDD
jgi:hypothetical protein